MAAAATPDAVVTLGADASPFAQAIDGANKALSKWGNEVVEVVRNTGDRMGNVWKAVGASLSSPIGLVAAPFRVATAAADGLVAVVTAPLKMIPIVGGAAVSVLHGVYDATKAVVGLIPSVVEGAISGVHKLANAIEGVADNLADLAGKTAEELGETLGQWSGDLSEWIASKLFGAKFGGKIGEFAREELTDVLKEFFTQDADMDVVGAHLKAAQGHAAGLALQIRQIGSRARETQWDWRDTWDNVRRDARQTVREIVDGFSGMHLGPKLQDDMADAFSTVSERAQGAFGQAEDFLGRVMVRIAEMVNRTLERFREPIAAVADVVQGLLEKLGLITGGLGSWGHSIRNAADLGQELVASVIGGVAYIGTTLGKLIGEIAGLLGDLIGVARDAFGRNIFDKAWDVIKLPSAIGGAVAAGVGAPETGAQIGMPGVSAWDRLSGKIDTDVQTGKGTQAALEEFARKMKAAPSAEDAMRKAKEWAEQQMLDAWIETVIRDAEFAKRRQEELDKMIDDLPLAKPQEFKADPQQTVQAVLANSREAANLLARAQTRVPGGDPMQKVADAAEKAGREQEKANRLLEEIKRALEKSQVIGTV